MPQDEDMYFNYPDDYEEYDEDDFFYHMYFDEVSTTPLPDEFYDILQSVSAGSNPQPVNYPEYSYLDYLNDRTIGGPANFSAVSLRNPNATTSRPVRTPPTFPPRRRARLPFKKRRKPAPPSVTESATDPLPRSNRYLRNGKKSRWRRTARRSGNRRRRQKNRRRRKRKKVVDPRIVGILDRRIPTLFRQAAFVKISLASFVVLSTGVTNAIPIGRKKIIPLYKGVVQVYGNTHRYIEHYNRMKM